MRDCRRPFGDYRIAGRLLVERQRWPDLVASIADGRLFRPAEIPQFAMRREAIQGALVSVSIIFGIPVLRSHGAEESARLMFYARRQVRDMGAGALPRAGARPKSKRRIQLHILQGLPAVGPVRAASLLERYGSVERVVTAGIEDLTLARGIGTAVAAKIRWAVTELESRAGGG